MTQKVWLEVALNGGWTRKKQPLLPVTRQELIDEAVDCVQAGASIVHLHAYDENTGRQNDDPGVYEDVIRAVKERCDAIIYPTVGQYPADPDSPRRYAPIEALCAKGLLEWSVVDPGSVNFSLLEDVRHDLTGYIYSNSEVHVRRGMELARRYKYHPSYAIYEPGFIRLGAALYRQYPGVPMPLYRFMLTDVFAFGLPAEPFSLETYIKLMQREHPEAPWMTAGRCTDISLLVKPTVEAGGHLRVGLEDAPLGTRLRNVDWVRKTVELIQAAGGEPASAKEIRVSLNKTMNGDKP